MEFNKINELCGGSGLTCITIEHIKETIRPPRFRRKHLYCNIYGIDDLLFYIYVVSIECGSVAVTHSECGSVAVTHSECGPVAVTHSECGPVAVTHSHHIKMFYKPYNSNTVKFLTCLDYTHKDFAFGIEDVWS